MYTMEKKRKEEGRTKEKKLEGKKNCFYINDEEGKEIEL